MRDSGIIRFQVESIMHFKRNEFRKEQISGPDCISTSNGMQNQLLFTVIIIIIFIYKEISEKYNEIPKCRKTNQVISLLLVI